MRLVVEVEPADHRVAQPLLAAAVELDVLRGPPPAEQLAAGGQLADQLDEGLVVRVAAGLEAQHRGGVVGDLVVVDEELPGRLGLEVDEPGGVGRPARVREHRGVERPGQLVHRQDVVPPVAHPGRRVGHRVEHLLDRRPDPLPAACASRRGPAAPRGPGRTDASARPRRAAGRRRGRRARSRRPRRGCRAPCGRSSRPRPPRASRPPLGAVPSPAGCRRTRAGRLVGESGVRAGC